MYSWAQAVSLGHSIISMFFAHSSDPFKLHHFSISSTIEIELALSSLDGKGIL